MLAFGGHNLLLGACLAIGGLVAAQSATTYVNPSVPTGTPVPGVYTGALRPQVHFSPPAGFMNDPNGMFVDAAGVWHLYYQYNPTGVAAGNQHWGHATSTDLYHWVNQPIALFPPEEGVYVFSGSAVVDADNTSGFFPNQTNGVVAVFTLARYYDDGSAGPQTQAIAYSLDGGYSFEYYDKNPVIDSTSSQFRDPKVFWHKPSKKWVAVIAFAQEFVVGVYTSPDLKAWTHASNFSHHGLLGAQYECPNLVQVPVRDSVGGSVIDEEAYVMTISVQPGAPLGGSATQYFPGRFNGTHFETFDAATRLTDFGKDNYAAQFFSGLEGKDAVSIGWASNWQYAQTVPTGPAEGWRSAMTLARRSYLTNATRIGWVLVDELVDVTPVLDIVLQQETWDGNGSLAVDYSAVESNAIYIDVNVTGLDASLVSGSSLFSLSFSSPVSGETVRSGFYFGGDQPFFVDRGLVRGFDNVFFTDKFSTADVWNATAGTWRFQGVVDRSIYEVFVDGGVHAGTFLFYPTQPLTLLSLAAADLPKGTKVSVAVWGLESAWARYEDQNGTVAGNVTGSAKRDAYEADFKLPEV
ncbi:glycoside hydrolase family 32 protein [Coniochaeta ligniaria NRRL 30616]|uniref:Glycoside hydrolase family 32 protein n=1 Tax=Coniochaeta ligniaria NRRL 30616 TaxID=1408157 RepID=A0A1J7J8D4_9PEZI|nr:glycoside hydrolase family 32 protein [Coniochaeta ligniaria NRRL 30616]